MTRFIVKKRPTGYWVYDQHNVELPVSRRLKREAQALADEWNADHERECAEYSERSYNQDRENPETRRASFRLIMGGAA